MPKGIVISRNPVITAIHGKIITMPNRSTDSLFQLIHSLQKSEKRNFKLYVQRNSSSPDLKIVQLFDAIRQDERI